MTHKQLNKKIKSVKSVTKLMETIDNEELNISLVSFSKHNKKRLSKKFED